MHDSRTRRRVLESLESYANGGGQFVRYYYAAELPEDRASDPFELGYSLIGVLLKELGYSDRTLISLSGNSITNTLVDRMHGVRAELREEFGLTTEELKKLERLNDESVGYEPVVEDPTAMLEAVRRVLNDSARGDSDPDSAEIRTA